MVGVKIKRKDNSTILKTISASSDKILKMAMGKGYRVFHKLPPDADTLYSVIMESKCREDSLMFESSAVVVLSSAEMDTVKKQYTKVLDAYGCLGVLRINAGNQNIMYLVMVTGCLSVGKVSESEVFRITAVQLVSLRNDPNDEEFIVDVRKLLSSGTFYFSWSSSGIPWDLSLCAQRKQQDYETDNRFFWNRMLHVHFQRYGIDCGQWLLKIMCGGVEIRTIYAAHRQAKACLISRLSCERAGTRFNVRGTNDDGHVANFCETEQVIFLENQVSSFIQTRGSVPLFWEQTGIQVGSHKIHMSRGYEASAPAYDRHLQMIRQQYGDQVICNLLGAKEGEMMLSQAFENHHKASPHRQDIPYIHFDYHSEIRGTNLKNLDKLRSKLNKYIDKFDFCYIEDGNAKNQQTGTIRTNCIDCLDRTNSVQTMIGLQILAKQVESLGLANKPQMLARFLEVYKQIWGINGDHVSRIYAGTGALGGGRSKASDAARTANRAIQNNFLDNSKQEAIDNLLLGNSLTGELADKARALLTTRTLHAATGILHGMVKRYQEYTQPTSLKISIGTWNVNGGKHFRSIAYKDKSMHDWLIDMHKHVDPKYLEEDADYEKPTDIYAIGFEEIVDLNASNIMSASTTNAKEWQKEILKTICRDHKYVILTQIQLVGVVLFVYIRPHLAPFIRDVAVEKVKTGMGGATGNKGGVGIRFLVHSTSLCFVCAHLAAGQSQISDRNADYHEINRKMAFPMDVCMGRSIYTHDYIFWCGDFNYRIDLGNDEVKELVHIENWGALQDCDQLNVQRSEAKAFRNLHEGKTNFPPTYKYDVFSDDYDTSEKNRTPAWTDRILWRRRHLLPHEEEKPDPSWNEGQLLLYSRAELRTSDHRPVVGVFDIEVLQVDEDKKDEVMQNVISQLGPPNGTVIVSLAAGGELDDETVNKVVEIFSELGDITIVRFVDIDMWIIYQNGSSALLAIDLDQMEVNGNKISVRLRTEDWQDAIQKELDLCSINTAALYQPFTNSLLGDDFSIPTMEFDMGDDEDFDSAGDSSLAVPLVPSPCSSGRSSPTMSYSDTSQAPGGPPSDSIQPSGGMSKTLEVESSQLTQQEAPKKQPPPRPGLPPVKPPPPNRPPGGPAKSSAPPGGPAKPMIPPGGPSKPINPLTTNPSAPGSPGRAMTIEAPKIRQPLRPPPSANVKSKKGGQRISSIGLPTNVTHHGHATSVEDAEKLIGRLLGAPSFEEDLPPPMIPGVKVKPVDNLQAPKPIPRSRTANDIESGSKTTDDNTMAVAAPKPMPRFKSLENLASTDKQDSETVQMRERNVNGNSISQNIPVTQRPKPAPRRDIQSCIISPQEESDVKKVRPVTELIHGKPPIVSKPNPGRSENSPEHGMKNVSSSSSLSNPLDAPVPENSKDAYDPFDTSKFKIPHLHRIQDKEAVVASSDPFDTSSSKTVPPAVPARPSRTEGQPAVDAAVPRSNDTADPFDTSTVHSHFVNHPSPLVPTQPQKEDAPSSSSSVCPNMSPPPTPPLSDCPQEHPPPTPPAYGCPEGPPPPTPPADSCPEGPPPSTPPADSCPEGPPPPTPPAGSCPEGPPPPTPPADSCPEGPPPPTPPVSSGCPQEAPPPPPRKDVETERHVISNLPPPPIPRRPGSPSDTQSANQASRAGGPPPVPHRIDLK